MDNQRFTELLAKELTNLLSPEEREEFFSHIRQDEISRREFEIVNSYWTDKEVAFTDISSAFEKVKGKIFNEEKKPGLYRRLTVRQKYVAAAVCIPLIASIYLLHGLQPAADGNATQVRWQEKYIAKGARSNLILPDGTHIMLNADSRLRYPTDFGGKTREVYLSGEAFFDVSKDAEHPFIIHTDKMNIRVLGTAFDVKSYSNDPSTETTLLRGSVEVTFPDRPSDRIILKPKDKLIINLPRKTEPSLTNSPLAADTERTAAAGAAPETRYSITALTYFKPMDSTIVETSWMDNKLVFQNEEFQSLARKMERWYGVRIVFRNQQIASCRFTGLFRKETIQEALFALQLSEKFQYILNGSTLFID